MYLGIICDLFIASSSDCKEAKPVIAQACYEWNQIHGHREGVFIQPRFCEVDGYPALCRPQDQLNKVLDKCDIAVALVWYKFANGLREELERSIQQQKKLLVYFSEKGISPKNFNEANMDAIENFKGSHQENAYWWSYESDEQLAELFKRQLQQTMNNLLENEIAGYKSEHEALRFASTANPNATQSSVPSLDQLIAEDPHGFIRDFGNRRGREIYREYITPEKLSQETLKGLEALTAEERAAFASLFDGVGAVVQSGKIRIEGLDYPAFGVPAEEAAWDMFSGIDSAKISILQNAGVLHKEKSVIHRHYGPQGGFTIHEIRNMRDCTREIYSFVKKYQQLIPLLGQPASNQGNYFATGKVISKFHEIKPS